MNFAHYIVPLLVIVSGAVLIAVIFSIRQRTALKRLASLEAWADEAGLFISPLRDDMLLNQFSDLQCFDQGSDQFADNVISGAWQGYSVQAFDFHYTKEYGRSEVERVFSALVVGAPSRLKPLFIRPAEFKDHLAQAFGAQDIHFESAEFNRIFVVQAPDRKWAFDVLHPRAMALLLRTPSFAIEFSERSVLVAGRRRFQAGEYAQALALVVGLLELLPKYAMQQEVAAGENEK